MRKALVLMGGGIDSTTVLVWAVNRFDTHAFWVDYGQVAADREHEAVEYFCEKYKVPLKVVEFDMSQIGRSAILRGYETMKENNLDGRNTVLLTMAAVYAAGAGRNELLLGYHSQPENRPFPDSTFQAARAMGELLHVAFHHPIILTTPFAHLDRTELARVAMNLDPEILTHTHTCYSDVKGGCGKCAHCLQREAIIENIRTGRNDPLPDNR